MFVCIYGVLSYFYFFYIFLGLLFFALNGATRFAEIQVLFPWTIDGVDKGDSLTSLQIDAALLGLFAIQHLIMARKWWKNFFNGIFPDTCERSTFVLWSTIALHVMLHFWHPMNEVVWEIPEAFHFATDCVCLLGWTIVLLSTFNIDHFHLFGLRQSIGFDFLVCDQFVVSYFYKFIRHPIMTGFMIAFWATPVMTQGHLLFAVIWTGFILFTVAAFEEPNLVEDVPEYASYKKVVPAYCPMPGMSWSSKEAKRK